MNLPTYTKIAKVEGNLKGATLTWDWEWSGASPAPNVFPLGPGCIVTNQAIGPRPFVMPNSGVLTLTPKLMCGENVTELSPLTLNVGFNFVEPSQPCCVGKIDPSDCPPCECLAEPIFPFTWGWLPDYNDPDCGTFYDDPSLDGVQLNVLLDGDGWSLPENYYLLGLAGGALGDNYQVILPGGVRISDDPEYIDLWGYSGPFYLYNETVKKRYKAYDQTLEGCVGRGLRTYPGVASFGPYWRGDSMIGAVGRNEVLVEMWYSLNNSRSNKNVGFSGYTHFGDQRDLFPYIDTGGQVLPTYRAGIVKSSVSIKDADISDFKIGGIYEGTPSGFVMKFIRDGVVVEEKTGDYIPDNIRADMETTFDGQSSELAGSSQGLVGFKLMASRFFPLYESTTVGVGFGGGYLGTLDTFECRYGFYVNLGSIETMLWIDPPVMWTHPGWPCP